MTMPYPLMLKITQGDVIADMFDVALYIEPGNIVSDAGRGNVLCGVVCVCVGGGG